MAVFLALCEQRRVWKARDVVTPIVCGKGPDENLVSSEQPPNCPVNPQKDVTLEENLALEGLDIAQDSHKE